MPDQDLLRFIREARKRSFSLEEIRAPLLKQGWPIEEIEKAFLTLKLKSEKKVSIAISLPQSVINIIEKRSKKNLLSIEEQIEDIVRRSAVTGKARTTHSDNIDDLLVSIFSRKMRKTNRAS